MSKMSTTKKRTVWRHHQRIKQTAAQKALLKVKCKKHCEEYAAALIAARDIVKEQAALLCEKFGQHSIDYYFEEIMQHSRLTGRCKVTKWNAFVKKEVECHNSGTCVILFYCLFKLTIEFQHYQLVKNGTKPASSCHKFVHDGKTWTNTSVLLKQKISLSL